MGDMPPITPFPADAEDAPGFGSSLDRWKGHLWLAAFKELSPRSCRWCLENGVTQSTKLGTTDQTQHCPLLFTFALKLNQYRPTMDITQKSDDWSVLRDAVERRRIQNRVAQRNYRTSRRNKYMFLYPVDAYAYGVVGRKRKELLEQQRLETENAPSCRCSVSAPESSSSSSTSTTHGGSSSDGNTNRDSGSSADTSCSDYLNSTIYTSPSQHMSQMCLGTNPGSKDQAPFFTPIPNTTSAAHGTNPTGSRESLPFSHYDELQNYSPPCQMQDGSLAFGLVNTSVTLAKHGELGQYEELFEDSWSEVRVARHLAHRPPTAH